MVRDLSLPDPHHINRFEMNRRMGRSNSKKRALVSPMVSFVRRHTVAVRELPVDFGIKVRKCLPHVRVKLAHSGLVWSCSRLRRVIDKIICEEFLEYFEFPFCLELPRCCDAQLPSLH